MPPCKLGKKNNTKKKNFFLIRTIPFEQKGEPVLRLPLEMGICDYQEGHPADAWETMSNAPWGVRLACRLLQERAKGEDSEWAPYLALIPDEVPGSPLLYTESEVIALQYPPAVAEAKEMREAVYTWHAKLVKECPSALAGADYDAFRAAVSVVHSRTYGVASSAGQGFFRALLPLADMLNHGGDEYPPEASALALAAAAEKETINNNNDDNTVPGDARDGDRDENPFVDVSDDEDEMAPSPSTTTAVLDVPNKWPPSSCSDNIAWSELDDDGVIEFAATRDVEANEEATMSYGERSNDHFLMYYGFVPPRNPHDDVILFSDIDHALGWHIVFHPELWDDETAETREKAARAAVKQVELGLAETADGDLVKAEPRLKVLPGGRCDARLVSLFAAAYAGTDEGVAAGGPVMQVDIDSAHADVARRCAELLRGMPTTLEEDYTIIDGGDGAGGGGGGELKKRKKKEEEEEEEGEGEASAGAEMAVMYRAHKKEVLLDAIATLGGNVVKA